MHKFLVALVCAYILAAAPTRADEAPPLTPPQALELARHDQLTIVDVRQPEEWRDSGVAEGAALIPMGHPGGKDGFIQDVLKLTKGDKNAPVGVVCRSGRRSAAMAKVLNEAGFTRVHNISGGMGGWINGGLPVIPCPTC